MSKLLDELNPSQREAVTHTIGPLLIIAGPGSGKTRTVVHSIAYAIENGVQPDRILAFSFTGKACGDLERQVKKNVDEEKANLVQISTFHNFCRRVLREDIEKLSKGYKRNFKELELEDQKREVNKQIAKVRTQINHLQHHKFLKTKDILDFITRCKLQFIPPSVANEHVPHSEMPPEISRAYVEIYERYERVLEANGWIDYANQLLLANELLRDVSEVKKEWQEKFELIFVDEYQDTDPVQYQIIETLAEKHQNLRVVGDDDQGIYSFRGADIQNILNFEKDYSTAKIIPLGQNYRSTQRIVDASRALAEFNPNRRKKELFTQNSAGKNIIHLHCKSAEEEIRTITSFIIGAIRCGWNSKDFAILCRLKSQVGEFKTAFNSLGIPSDSVSIMTIHGAKGLEFPNVFVAGVCKGLLPFGDNEQNEERRLLYVAMTRAENWLCLSSYEGEAGSNMNGKSPFLDQIPSNLLEPIQILGDSHIPPKLIKSNGTKSSRVVEESLDSTTLSPIRPEIVLGIDPGKIDANNPNVGWAVTEKSSNGYVVIDCNTETPNGTLDAKLEQIEHQINKLIVDHSPDAIAVERLEGATDGGLMGVAGCVALVGYIANQHGIECAFYSPQQVKYAATGNRNANKEQVQEGVKTRCNLQMVQNNNRVDDHSADAIAVSFCYLDSYLKSSRLQWKKRKQGHYNSGLVYLSNGRYNIAVAEFEEAINTDPVYTDAHCGLGRAYLAQGNLEEAANVVKKSLKLAENNHPDSQKLLDAIKHYHLGCSAVDNKRFNEAITEFQESIDLEPLFINARYELSRTHLRLGNVKIVKNVVEKALKLADEYPPIQQLSEAIRLYNTGLNFLNDRRYNDAVDKLKEIIDREPIFTEAHYWLGYAHFHNKALEAAEQSANDTLELDTNHQPARDLLGEIKKAYVNKGYDALERLYLTEAEKYTNKAFHIDKNCQLAHKLSESIKQAYYKRGLKHLNNLQYDAAIAAFEETINRYPKFTEAHCELGQVYLGRGNLGAAEKSARAALALENGYQSALQILDDIKQKHWEQGTDSLKENNLTEAKRFAGEALRLDVCYQPALNLLEDIKHAYYNRGCTYLDNRQYDEAIVAFEETTNKYPKFTKAHCGLGQVYLGRGNLGAAEKSARAALALENDYQSALQILESVKHKHCEFARDYLNQEDLPAAEKSAKEALRLDGNYSDAHTLLETIGKIYCSQGLAYLTDRAFDSAVESFQKAKDIEPGNKVVWTNLGQAYYWIDDYANAASCYQKAANLDSQDKNVHSNLGNAYYWMNAYAKAIKPLQKARDLDPDCEKFHYYLGRAYFKLNKLEQSKQAIVEALKIDPTYQPASELLQKIQKINKRIHEIIRSNNPDMILIPAGKFQMGSGDREASSNEKPVHTVYLDDFYMDKYPVTNAQYKRFIEANPQWRKYRIPRKYHNGHYLKHWDGNNYPNGKGNHPVVYISWYAASAYTQWVGKCLPTEAQWEKAARGGVLGWKYPWGNLIDLSKANYNRNAGGTTTVDNYSPNSYGLYDMVGNVWEWCLDRYDENFYIRSSCRNPFAAGTLKDVIGSFQNVKTDRVLRGGSWDVEPQDMRSTTRAWGNPTNSFRDLGFRCLKPVVP